MKKFFVDISNDKFLAMLFVIIIIVLIVMIGIIVIVVVIQHGKTKRVKTLADVSSPNKKREIGEKRLENEMLDDKDNKESKIIDYAERIAKLSK